MAWDAIELTRLTRVAQDAKHCMAWDAIEGDRTHMFDSVAQDASESLLLILPAEKVVFMFWSLRLMIKDYLLCWKYQ